MDQMGGQMPNRCIYAFSYSWPVQQMSNK